MSSKCALLSVNHLLRDLQTFQICKLPSFFSSVVLSPKKTLSQDPILSDKRLCHLKPKAEIKLYPTGIAMAPLSVVEESPLQTQRTSY